MNTTTIEHPQERAGSGRAQRRIGRLACAVLALMATSAGLGALAQRESGFWGTKPAAPVVYENGGFGSGGINPSRPTSQCPSTYPGTRVVLLASRFPTSPCASPAVLVSDRVSARPAL
jgi:hypothetical protein